MKIKASKLERKSKFAFKSQASTSVLNNSNPTATTGTSHPTVSYLCRVV